MKQAVASLVAVRLKCLKMIKNPPRLVRSNAIFEPKRNKA